MDVTIHQSLFPGVPKVLVAFIFKLSSSATHLTLILPRPRTGTR